MAVRILTGDEKASYFENLLQALDTAQEALPGDAGRFAKILRIAEFGKDLPSLDRILIDSDTGLPVKHLFDVLSAHKKAIELEHPMSAEARIGLITRIKEDIYRNNFDFAEQLGNLKECLFSERLRNMDFRADVSIDVTAGPTLDKGVRRDVVVRGYDYVKGGIMRYDLQVYELSKGVVGGLVNSVTGRHTFFSTHTGSPKPNKNLRSTVDDCFGSGAKRWFEAFGNNDFARVGSVRIQHIRGFYTNESTSDDHLADIARSNGGWILDIEMIEREDTDVTLCEDFTAEFLDPKYTPEIVTENRKYLITSDETRAAAREYARSRTEYRCEVL
ncbi:TPA: hypothetical protein HA251_06625 [Candidatus Woesearchaeota archaeon]|nr:hypothetical protein [Candidatus Woesearchaeota archaeon]